MRRVSSQTQYRWSWVWGGGVAVLVGAVLLGVAVGRTGLGFRLMPELGFAATSWSIFAFLPLSGAALKTAFQLPLGVPLNWVLGGSAFWIVGWGMIAAGIRRAPANSGPPSEAAGAPLYPRLAQYSDFHWGSLLAYGGGILLAQISLILIHTAVAGSVRGSEVESGGVGLAPVAAFGVALTLAFIIAFFAGFVGAARAGRLSVPEATLAVVYFGLPVPIFLSLVDRVPDLQIRFGPMLREVTYIASLLGRPELGYWLTFVGLVLALVLGITNGFVATSGGKLNLRAGFELFVARRHVGVFRPRLLIGTLLVLLFLVIPPLIIYAILKAADAAVERTRIRALGLKDPLDATAALHEARQRELSPTAMMTALSVGGVGVGVMALIIVLSVMSGFEADLKQKILGTNAHAVVLSFGPEFPDYAGAVKKVGEVNGVVGKTPFIMNEVMIASEGNISGVIIKGIDPKTVGEVTDLPQNIQPGGSLENLEKPEKILEPRLSPREEGALDERPALEDDPMIQRAPSTGEPETVIPGILMGRELAASLKVFVGDRVNVVSPLGGELGPQGPMPKSRPFRVAGIFYSGMYEYDSKFVYIRLDEAQSFFNIKGVTGIELKVKDIDDARRISRSVLDKLGGYPYRTKDWGEMNRNLFSALRLEKLVMAIILSIIVIVAAGLIVATVIMLVLEKRKEISVLKALGVSDGGIVKIFLAEGLQIGVAGGLLGLVAGLALCFLIERVGIKLDPEVYYIPALPVKIEPLQTAICVLIAVLVTFLGSIYPALKASQVEPVEGLKAE